MKRLARCLPEQATQRQALQIGFAASPVPAAPIQWCVADLALVIDILRDYRTLLASEAEMHGNYSACMPANLNVRAHVDIVMATSECNKCNKY